MASLVWPRCLLDLLLGNRPVGAHLHTRAAGDRGDKLERAQCTVVGEYRLAAAEDDRLDHEPELIEQASTQEGPHERRAP